jgi:Fic-DOC domain mobile mystery protein B
MSLRPLGPPPLTPAERDGLPQAWITHRRDLNEAEQENIVRGANWAHRQRGLTPRRVLDDAFARTLHKRMFGDVWQWAGGSRHTERNIGVPAHRIAADLAVLFDDAIYWVAHQTYPPDKVAIRFHHRLVAIHPFANGNGRHARLMADLLSETLKGAVFTWGGGRLADVVALRGRFGLLTTTISARFSLWRDHEQPSPDGPAPGDPPLSYPAVNCMEKMQFAPTSARTTLRSILTSISPHAKSPRSDFVAVLWWPERRGVQPRLVAS